MADSDVTARSREASSFDAAIVGRAMLDALRKLDPRVMKRNPVMFVVEIGSVVSTYYALSATFGGSGDAGFIWAVSAWLWFTVVFANFAEAMAEGRGKAQADTLRAMKTDTVANLVVGAVSRSSRHPSFAAATRSSSRPARSSPAMAT